MKELKKNNFLFQDVRKLKGVGIKLSKYLKKKKIEKINDLLWNLPYSYTDRSNIDELDKLQIGKLSTIKVKTVKYSFPRIRNLPNKIICKNENGQIDIVHFNSREGYLRKIYPLNEWLIISGKINFFKNKYQITNPDYISKIENIDYVKRIIPKYSLTDGLTEKTYRKIIEQVIEKIPDIEEWHNEYVIKKLKFSSWKESIINLHKNEKNRDINSIYYKRLAFDEIYSNLLVLANNRKKIKKIKKK